MMEFDIFRREDCEKILQRSITDFPAKLISYKLSRFSDKVMGYMGDYFSLELEYSYEIDGKTSGNTEKSIVQKTRFFVKTIPIYNANQLSYTNEMGVFRKESFLYENMLNELMKIVGFSAHCFFTSEKCIVLEDLCFKGFSTLSDSNYLQESHCISLLKTLGKFHASTIIYEETHEGIKLDEHLGKIEECCFNFIEGHPRQKWCVSTTRCVTDCIKSMMPENSNASEISQRFSRFVFEQMPVFIEPSKEFRNVLTHDDLWCNNLMFNKTLECMIVDFQMSRYIPPALDFLLALYLNLEASYLNENFAKLVDIYYDSLNAEIQRNGFNTEKLLSKSEFMDSVEYYKLAALTEAAMYGTHVFISEKLGQKVISDPAIFEEFSFVNRSKLIGQELDENLEFKQRLSGILFPLIQELECL